MKKIVWLTSLMVFGALMLSGCLSMAMSMGTALAKAKYKDFGVYDKSVPESEQAELRFTFVKMRTFNGKPVIWEGKDANNLGRVRIPSGTHDLVFDWIQETTKLTDVNFSGNNNNTITYT